MAGCRLPGAAGLVVIGRHVAAAVGPVRRTRSTTVHERPAERVPVVFQVAGPGRQSRAAADIICRPTPACPPTLASPGAG